MKQLHFSKVVYVNLVFEALRLRRHIVRSFMIFELNYLHRLESVSTR